MSDLRKQPERNVTIEEITSPTGCGAGTKRACYALASGPAGFGCSHFLAPDIAVQAEVILNGRVNVDPEDGKTWCPLGILPDSKTDE